MNPYKGRKIFEQWKRSKDNNQRRRLGSGSISGSRTSSSSSLGSSPSPLSSPTSPSPVKTLTVMQSPTEETRRYVIHRNKKNKHISYISFPFVSSLMQSPHCLSQPDRSPLSIRLANSPQQPECFVLTAISSVVDCAGVFCLHASAECKAKEIINVAPFICLDL